MTLERILKAAVNSMITGHHAAHCFHAHTRGLGYVNDGSIVADRPEYLRQLQRTAESEVANVGFAREYAEPGYAQDQPARGIVFANWNCLPRDLDRVLASAGYVAEWSDEWTCCEDCQRAFRTSPNSYDWRMYGQYIEGDRNWDSAYHSESVELCLDCLQEWAETQRRYELESEAEAAADVAE